MIKMIVGSHKRMLVYKKTNFKCSCCGSSKDLMCACFIPEWTRIVDDSIDNLIPLCLDCYLNRKCDFIELGHLRYLPKLYIQQLVRYYKSISKYLYKYVRMYGYYRTSGKIDVDKNILILSSYDSYYEENKDELKWENL